VKFSLISLLLHLGFLTALLILPSSRIKEFALPQTFWYWNLVLFSLGVANVILTKLNSVALVHKQTIPTEPLISEDSANFFADIVCRVVSATDPHDR
jgi:hypothetical protein